MWDVSIIVRCSLAKIFPDKDNKKLVRLLGMQWHLILTLQISSSLPIGFIKITLKSQQHTLTLFQNQPFLYAPQEQMPISHEYLKVYSTAQLRYGIFFLDVCWYFMVPRKVLSWQPSFCPELTLLQPCESFSVIGKVLLIKSKQLGDFIITSMPFYGRSLKIWKMWHLKTF